MSDIYEIAEREYPGQCPRDLYPVTVETIERGHGGLHVIGSQPATPSLESTPLS